MSTENESVRRDPGAENEALPRAEATPPAGDRATETHKPSMLWMLLPIVLIAVAFLLAR